MGTTLQALQRVIGSADFLGSVTIIRWPAPGNGTGRPSTLDQSSRMRSIGLLMLAHTTRSIAKIGQEAPAVNGQPVFVFSSMPFEK